MRLDEGIEEAAHSLHPDGRETARAAHLRYVTDTRPGIRRVPDGDGFRYEHPDGSPVTGERDLARIQALAIPPAWTEVWICPLPHGHIQATGRDVRGRKQYRYHARWHAERDSTKYDRMLAFSAALPRLRERVNQDLGLPGLTRERVLATTVRLLEMTLIRVGNEEYARANGSYGLTTLHSEHVDVSGTRIQFHFRGKSGKEWAVEVRDRRLSRVVQRCQELPGQELFQYVDDQGERRPVTSCDVNAYLREVSGDDFTAKDFRTWAGTVLAYSHLCAVEACETETQAKKCVAGVIKAVAERLGNTPAVCRKCYVHPAVLETFADETRRSLLREAREAAAEAGLEPDEAALRWLLQRLSHAAHAEAQSQRAA